MQSAGGCQRTTHNRKWLRSARVIKRATCSVGIHDESRAAATDVIRGYPIKASDSKRRFARIIEPWALGGGNRLAFAWSFNVGMRYLAPEKLAELQQLTRVFRANALIVGALTAHQRDEILHTVNGLGCDVFHAQRHSRLMLPNGRDVVVVLDDVCALSWDDQDRLLKWIERREGRILSFASRSPYAMVRAGSFLERLYYHLNTICLVLGDE